jgi:putative transposase
MARKNYPVEEIIKYLRTVEIETGRGISIEDACRKSGIAHQNYYRWKKEYGGMQVDQAKRLKEIELENQRLRRLVSDLSIDNLILKEISSKNF